MNKLFDIPEQEKPKSKFKCKDCKHRQRWQCNSKVFQYCGLIKSKMTQNRLKKIKCKDEACKLFEHE